MIKTAQDAYLAGRQAGMEKIAYAYGSANLSVLADNLGLNGLGYGVAGTVAGTGLGTYLGDKNLRSAGISAAGALGGGQIGANLALAGVNALQAIKIGDPKTREALSRLNLNTSPIFQDETGLSNFEMSLLHNRANELGKLHRLSRKIMGASNLIGQIAGGAAAGHYTKRGENR